MDLPFSEASRDASRPPLSLAGQAPREPRDRARAASVASPAIGPIRLVESALPAVRPPGLGYAARRGFGGTLPGARGSRPGTLGSAEARGQGHPRDRTRPLAVVAAVFPSSRARRCLGDGRQTRAHRPAQDRPHLRRQLQPRARPGRHRRPAPLQRAGHDVRARGVRHRLPQPHPGDRRRGVRGRRPHPVPRAADRTAVVVAARTRSAAAPPASPRRPVTAPCPCSGPRTARRTRRWRPPPARRASCTRCCGTSTPTTGRDSRRPPSATTCSATPTTAPSS